MFLSIDEARGLVERSMVAVGHTRGEAEIIGDHLIDCELRGLSFGGLPRALSVVEQAQHCGRRQHAITVLRETPVSASIDGGDQVGYLVARRATQMAIEKARTMGLAVVGARNTWYTGMFSYYLEMITSAGFVGMLAGNCGPLVAPQGGTERRFGTNPIAFGFPSSAGPVIWDIGTSSMMLGEVTLRRWLGEALPHDCAFDSEGNATRDPAAALDGALTVWGGHKGSGLALVIHLLGMMCGAEAASPNLADCGFFALVVDPEALTSAEDYRRRVAAYADSVRSTRALDPETPVRVPFDRSVAERARRRKGDVIEVSDEICAALSQVGDTATLT